VQDLAMLDDRLDDVNHLDPPVLFAHGQRRQRHLVRMRRIAPAVGQILPLLHPRAFLVHVEDAGAVLHGQALGAPLVWLGQAQQLREELDPVCPAVRHHAEGIERPWHDGLVKPAAVYEPAGQSFHIGAHGSLRLLRHGRARGAAQHVLHPGKQILDGALPDTWQQIGATLCAQLHDTGAVVDAAHHRRHGDLLRRHARQRGEPHRVHGQADARAERDRVDVGHGLHSHGVGRGGIRVVEDPG
jgi:hypothetical protein